MPLLMKNMPVPMQKMLMSADAEDVDAEEADAEDADAEDADVCQCTR